MDLGSFLPPFFGVLSACHLSIDFGIAAEFDLNKPFKMTELRITGMREQGSGPATVDFRTPPFQPSTREMMAWILEYLHRLSKRKQV